MQLYHFLDQSYHHPQLLPEMYATFRLHNFELLRTSSSGAPCGSTSCAWPARSERRGGGRGKYFHLFQTFISSPKVSKLKQTILLSQEIEQQHCLGHNWDNCWAKRNIFSGNFRLIFLMVVMLRL